MGDFLRVRIMEKEEQRQHEARERGRASIKFQLQVLYKRKKEYDGTV